MRSSSATTCASASPPATDDPRPMRAYVGVTDRDWYRRLLATGPHHDEVNFWFPSPKQGFQALSPGQPFVFRPTSSGPTRRSATGLWASACSRGSRARQSARHGVSWAPPMVSPHSEMLRGSIEHYVRRPITRFEDPLIGCVFLQDVTFFAESETLPAPDDFAPNLVRGRKYDLADIGAGHSVVGHCCGMMNCSPDRSTAKQGTLSETTRITDVDGSSYRPAGIQGGDRREHTIIVAPSPATRSGPCSGCAHPARGRRWHPSNRQRTAPSIRRP